MSERGSTGASARTTTRPSARRRSRSQMLQFTTASTTRPARTATTLRTRHLARGRPPTLQREARREQREPRSREEGGLRQQRRVKRVVVVREVAEESRDPEPDE